MTQAIATFHYSSATHEVSNEREHIYKHNKYVGIFLS